MKKAYITPTSSTNPSLQISSDVGELLKNNFGGWPPSRHIIL